ncbi:CRE-CEH-45 protein [Aphelenchoides avenae]|nr:CRE-CEH-45 protein [Aphelenchus avenae]
MSNFSIQKILDFPSNFPTSMANANAMMAAAMSAFASTTAGLQLPTSAAAASALLPPQFPSPVDFYAAQYNLFPSAAATAGAGFSPFFMNMFPNPYLSATGAQMFSPSALMSHSGKRKRRHRTIFSEEQLAVLEATFNATQYPDVSLREKLAEQCELKEERVEVWFKNRRAKERKKSRDGRTAENANSTGSNASDGGTIQISEESDCDVSDDNESAVASPPPTALKRKCVDPADAEGRSAEKRLRQDEPAAGGKSKPKNEQATPQGIKEAEESSCATHPVSANS